jgi:hypothetical protein
MPRTFFNLISTIDANDSFKEIQQKLFSFEIDTVAKLEELAQKKWFDKFNAEQDQSDAANIILRVLRNEQLFAPPVKNLYDFGLCHHNVKTKKVNAVSSLAETSLHTIYSTYNRSNSINILAEKSKELMGFNFESQIRSNIHTCYKRSVDGFDIKLQDSNNPIAIGFEASRVQYFDELEEIVIDDFFSCLWISRVTTFKCDGIIVPKKEDLNEKIPIIVYDVSVSDPFSQDRKEKIFALDVIRNDLAKVIKYENLRIFNVIFWHKDMKLAKKSRVKTKEMFPQNTYLVDRVGVCLLGVRI